MGPAVGLGRSYLLTVPSSAAKTGPPARRLWLLGGVGRKVRLYIVNGFGVWQDPTGVGECPSDFQRPSTVRLL